MQRPPVIIFVAMHHRCTPPPPAPSHSAHLSARARVRDVSQRNLDSSSAPRQCGSKRHPGPVCVGLALQSRMTLTHNSLNDTQCFLGDTWLHSRLRVRKVRFFIKLIFSSQHVILPRRLPLKSRLVSARLFARPCSDCACRTSHARMRESVFSHPCARARLLPEWHRAHVHTRRRASVGVRAHA